MSDRLTQLQVCLDQLIEQFNATINYINTNAEPAQLDEDPHSITNIAAQAPLPGQTDVANSNNTPAPTGEHPESTGSNPTNNAAVPVKTDFSTTLNELSGDIIIKSRQISMLIDGLPGIGVPPSDQLQMIEDLVKELKQVETERLQKIAEKDDLLKWCEELIVDVASGITKTRAQ
ncbi:mediator of RNA polymerase II transcription subunit 21 [Diutina catenulata]